MNLEEISMQINRGFELLVVGFTTKGFTELVVLISVLFAIVKIRRVFVPLVKLAVLYYSALLLALGAMYGVDDLQSLDSLRHVRRSVKAACVATFVCFATGVATPKCVRQSLK